MLRGRAWLVVAAIAVSIGVGGAAGAVVRAEAAAAGPTANLWIDADGGSCARREATSSYADAQACGSLQAAANAASAGDIVLIRDGRYPGQLLTGAKRLTFRGAGPGRPSFGQIITSAANVAFAHVLVENRDPPAGNTPCSYFDYTLFTCGPGQTYVDVIVDGLAKGSGNPERRGGLQVDAGSTNLVFRNGEIRGVLDSKGFQGGSDGMLIENTVFRDIRLSPAGEAAGVHNECAYVTGGDRQTWRRNRFLLCPVMAMFFANYLGGPPFSSVTIENNLFTHTLNSRGEWHNGASFVIPNGAGGQNQVTNWVVRYNTFETPPDFGSTPGTGDDNGSAHYYGNLGADGACGAREWTYRYNVGETCRGVGEVAVRGATNSSGRPNQAPFYVDAPAGDFRLRPRSAARDRGDRTRYPRADVEGGHRPLRAPDAGAYEYGTGVLAAGGLPASASGAAMRRFAGSNGADLLLALGGNSTRSAGAGWRRALGWATSAGIDLAGVRAPAAYYVRRARDVEVFVLDSGAVGAAQTAWLRQALARPATVPRVAVLRNGPLGCADEASSAAVRAQWAPLFERYRVRLVLSADEAGYQRFARGRVTSVVTGGSGAVASRSRCSAGARRRASRAERVFLYLVAEPGVITVRAVSLAGRTVDTFRVRS